MDVNGWQSSSSYSHYQGEVREVVEAGEHIGNNDLTFKRRSENISFIIQTNFECSSGRHLFPGRVRCFEYCREDIGGARLPETGAFHKNTQN